MIKDQKVVSYDVVDSDGHVIEPLDLWGGQYMPAAYRDKGPVVGSDDLLQYPGGREFPYKGSWGWMRVPVVRLGLLRTE